MTARRPAAIRPPSSLVTPTPTQQHITAEAPTERPRRRSVGRSWQLYGTSFFSRASLPPSFFPPLHSLSTSPPLRPSLARQFPCAAAALFLCPLQGAFGCIEPESLHCTRTLVTSRVTLHLTERILIEPWSIVNTSHTSWSLYI